MELTRPGTVQAAGWLAIACSMICLLVFSILTITFLFARDDFVETLRERAAEESQVPDVDPATLANVAIAVAAVFALWCLGAVAAAVLAMRRSRAGRWLLTVSAVVSSLFSMLGTLAIVIPFVFVMASVAVVVLLFTPSSNDWYARRGGYGTDLPTGTTQPWG